MVWLGDGAASGGDKGCTSFCRCDDVDHCGENQFVARTNKAYFHKDYYSIGNCNAYSSAAECLDPNYFYERAYERAYGRADDRAAYF